MTTRPGSWLAVAVAAAEVTVVVAGVGFALVAGDSPREFVEGWGLAEASIGLAFAIVGGLLAVKRPRNVIGWLFLVQAWLAAVAFADARVADLAAAGRWVAGAGLVDRLPVLSVPWAGPLVLVLLVFPDGRPRSRRWWAVVGPLTGVVAAVAVASPLGIEIGGHPIWDALEPVLLLGLPLAVVCLVLRFRSARGVERQRIRVLFVAAAAAVVALFVGASFQVLPYVNPLAIPAIPFAVAVAVLRYRLYDIDRVVSRTVTYVVLTAALAGSYASLVLGGQSLLGPDDAPDLVVAGATLVVAALFRPVRGWVQVRVDRRFNRARYDAARTVERFTGGLRDDVDLGTLSSDLRTVVAQTLQPDQVTLWLRPEAAP